MEFVRAGALRIVCPLHDFINHEVLPGSGAAAAESWQGGQLIHDLAPRNRALLDWRDDLQRQIEAGHMEHRDQPVCPDSYRDFPQPGGSHRRQRLRRIRLGTEAERGHQAAWLNHHPTKRAHYLRR
jgi:malate synthase